MKFSYTVPNLRELSGSMVFEQGDSVLSAAIIAHMKAYARKTGRIPLPFSHSETLIWNETARDIQVKKYKNKPAVIIHLKAQTLYTIGARSGGPQVTAVDQYYVHNHRLLIMKPIVLPTLQSDQALWDYFDTVKNSRYQTGNLFNWILMLKAEMDWSKPGDHKVYCYELDARFAIILKNWPRGKSPDMASIYDLYELMMYYEWSYETSNAA